MSIHVALKHVTRYKYDRPVSLGPQVVRLRPAPHCRTPVLSYSLRIEPAKHFINWQQDPFANYLARLVFPEKTTEFTVTVDLVAEMAVYNPFDFFLEPHAQTFPFEYDEAQKIELAPYLQAEPPTPLLAAYLAGIPRAERPTIDFLVELNQRVQNSVSYLIRLEPGVQTPEETLAKASGSCRDSGWLLVELLRHLGLAARFVSGYLIQLSPDEKALDGPSGTEVDFTDLHAWCEVYLPGAGWIGLDPTSGLLAGEGHIPLAATPTPGSAAPISGAVDESEVEFGHEMSVTRIYESPRVTRPYTEAQWAEVLKLGEQVDRDLADGDVRLTMGGEPTFVALDDRDAPEWNTEALGPTKRVYAQQLTHRLRDEYGQGGFLHFGQGKWYPGEQLPRWALSIHWRTDGQPCWRNPEWFADEREQHAYTDEHARTFMGALTRRLGLPDQHVQPAYEDTWYYLWRERRLPVNVDPFDSRLDDELERTRLRRVFDQGLSRVVGYVLPIRHAGEPSLAGARWETGPWFFRDERLYLIPGDSPMGWRLPLDALPWVSQGDYPYLVEQDPFAPRGQLPAAAALRAQTRGLASAGSTAGLRPSGPSGPAASGGAAGGDADAAQRPARFESAHWVTRTALCVEARDPRRANGPKAEAVGRASGVLYVFMPPLEKLDHYLELLVAVEAACEDTGFKIVLEGYPPPRDSRLKLLQVTPDPGVIEVNIHPAHDWGELVQHTEFLYEAARQTRLSSEKFMIDGRHSGTGGGNHFVLGGATPADSPFLRRPSLLASLLAYWHNHPSLSYLFSGLFIGPTSQAPRVDEARNDQLRELEIALGEIHKAEASLGAAMPPWLVDRTLRNVLVDVTGNTHRSEFCIDKLYSPDSTTGRLGLLELRAFEMPPHARMSIVQQLLLRALVARFWKTPYRSHLVRWGTELHDRWLLPHFVREDFADVLEDMAAAGYPLDPAWFAPHFEFRFPKYGEFASRGVHVTLRGALEPWHVMGEEGSAGGTVRYVDASLERLEVHVSGLVDPRHRITVNGQPLPLQPTGRVGEFVCGVRYRAWLPPSALHPTIGVHAPLTVDLVDTWQQKSLGGCRYFVAHPGGRNYATLPVNAYEAESRRLARFTAHGHTPGQVEVGEPRRSLEFPFTLDLRKAG
ncbi:transglutaminase family protein [Pelomonas sp. P7]|uniref:Transglutaminase family protein n=1 Tax=Pelomonas caseinilytica TaxID=2906763 RepID=A0ABS8XJH0_9BURK|nr:transglutaminase family protein [Pelomonas sp. P7]MCE4537360.1 transglutaminase family protein [Pelomonas sp. P7]